MNQTTCTAVINRLASSTTPVPLDDLMAELGIGATNVAELHKDGLATVSWTAEGNVVSLTAKGLGTIPLAESTTPAQHAVLQAIADSKNGQVPTTALYALENVKVNANVIVDMVSRKWIALERFEADGETTPAVISVSLGGKDGKTGTKALAYPVRASAAKVAGAPRTSNGQPVEHLPIPETFTKTFKERTFTCHGNGDGKTVVVDELGKSFASPSAAARAIITAVNGKSIEVNGWNWLGLTK